MQNSNFGASRLVFRRKRKESVCYTRWSSDRLGFVFVFISLCTVIPSMPITTFAELLFNVVSCLNSNVPYLVVVQLVLAVHVQTLAKWLSLT